MLEVSARDLVVSLRELRFRNRTGILLLPPALLGRECEVAARLGVSCRDHRELVLSRLVPDQRYLGADWKGIISADLREMVDSERPDGDCLLVSNVDLLLASFPAADRDQFWAFLREAFKPTWGLLLTLPSASRRLIGDDERKRWMHAGRLAIWE